MNYHLDLFTPHTWSVLWELGGTITGFTEHMKSRADKIKPGDVFVCYLVRLSRWCGALEVEEGPYVDRSPIFATENDKFVVRFRVKPLVVLKAEDAIPVGVLWNELKRTKDLDRSNRGWAYAAQMVASFAPVDPSDGQLIVERLQKQAKEPTPFPLDAAGRRLLLQRPVVTPKGPVEVIVPEEIDVDIGYEIDPDQTTPRESLKVQATLASIGAKMGYSIWLPRNDRAAVRAQMSTAEAAKLLDVLPLNYEDTTLKTVEQIDLIWLHGRSIVSRIRDRTHYCSLFRSLENGRFVGAATQHRHSAAYCRGRSKTGEGLS